MNDAAVEKIQAHYDLGLIPQSNLIFLIVSMAADRPPEELAFALREELLADVWSCVRRPPSAPEDVVIVRSWCGPSDGDWAAVQKMEKARYYDCVWRWHRYLAARFGGEKAVPVDLADAPRLENRRPDEAP